MQVNVQTVESTESIEAPDRASLALAIGSHLRNLGYDEATARRNDETFSFDDVTDGDTLVFTR